MKIVFDFGKAGMIVFKGLTMQSVNKRTARNASLDALLSDPDVKRMYIIANDNDIR